MFRQTAYWGAARMTEVAVPRAVGVRDRTFQRFLLNPLRGLPQREEYQCDNPLEKLKLI